MKKIITFLLLAALALLTACALDEPVQPQLTITQNQLILNKMVSIGNSLTAGIQSGGLLVDFQEHSYPNYIAQQIKKMNPNFDFQQPLVGAPGIGTTSGKTPLYINQDGQIVSDDLTVNPLTLLLNATLPRPYDNLGVPFAYLRDALNTAVGSQATLGNVPFFDIVLRNPNFAGMTQLDQLIVQKPTLILLWLGNNDVLFWVFGGGDETAYPTTSPADFQTQYTDLLTKLRAGTKAGIVMANIPHVTDIPYVNALDSIFHTSPMLGITVEVPVVFSAVNNQLGGKDAVPVDFGGGLYLPLLTEETGVEHVLLGALEQYQAIGLGVPDSAALVQMGLPPANASALVAGMRLAGLTPSGIPIPKNLTLTASETQAIRTRVGDYNTILNALSVPFQVPVVDINTKLSELNTQGIDSYSGKFVLQDPANTAFSLDGVHPNNGGQALIANEFIKVINQVFQLNIPQLDIQQYKGQYVGKPIHGIAPGTTLVPGPIISN